MQPSLPHIDHNTRQDISAAIVHEAARFDQLKEAWEELMERSDATVFQSFEWQRTWWQFFGKNSKDRRLFLVTVHSADQLVAIAPFFIERLTLAGLLTVRCLRLIGHGVSDYLNIICARGYEVTVTGALLSSLIASRNQFDVVTLEDFPNTSPFHRELYMGFISAGFSGSHFQNAQCPRTILNESWESTLASFSNKHRKDISYELRNIHRKFSVELEVTATRHAVQENMEEFIAMHQERWMLAGYPGVFRDTKQADFHRHVALQCFDRGWLFLAFLKLDNRRVAVNYGFQFRETLSTYLNGMIDLGDMAKFSPGKILHELSMQEGIKGGKLIYDFMRGRERYKYALNAADEPNWAIILYRDGSLFIKTKFKLHLLGSSMKRRLQKEMMMFRHVANTHGLLSVSMGRHITARLRQNTLDSVQKAKEPEKSLDQARL